MIEIKETCYKGTRILLGNNKRNLVNSMINFIKAAGYVEIQIPNIQYQETFASKVGEENNNMMYNFKDRGDRDICLAPEYTAIIQQLAKTIFKHRQDVKVFYVQECFRGEKPQAGRYRQFTQFGVEIINPKYPEGALVEVESLAMNIVYNSLSRDLFNGKEEEYHVVLDRDTKRGLDYYKDGLGFEISIPELGAQSQICGGGSYEGGVGFAIGIDRIYPLTKFAFTP